MGQKKTDGTDGADERRGMQINDDDDGEEQSSRNQVSGKEWDIIDRVRTKKSVHLCKCNERRGREKERERDCKGLEQGSIDAKGVQVGYSWDRREKASRMEKGRDLGETERGACSRYAYMWDVTQSLGTALIPGDLINRKQDYRANRREITPPPTASTYVRACPLWLHNASWWWLRSTPFLDLELSPWIWEERVGSHRFNYDRSVKPMTLRNQYRPSPFLFPSISWFALNFENVQFTWTHQFVAFCFASFRFTVLTFTLQSTSK